MRRNKLLNEFTPMGIDKESKYELVSLVAYLIGVEKRHFESEKEPPKIEIYEELEKRKKIGR